MRTLDFVWRFCVALAALPLGFALILGLPLGVLYLLSFISGWVGLTVFVPGFALYVLGVCVPVGLVQWRRWKTKQPSSILRLPGAVWLGGAAVLAIGLGQLLLVAH